MSYQYSYASLPPKPKRRFLPRLLKWLFLLLLVSPAVGLILAFIFLAPRSCLHKKAQGAAGVATAPPAAAASQGAR